MTKPCPLNKSADRAEVCDRISQIYTSLNITFRHEHRSQREEMRRLIISALFALAAPCLAIAQTSTGIGLDVRFDDANSPDAIAWANARTEQTVRILQSDPKYQESYKGASLQYLSADHPQYPWFVHGEIYERWRDQKHQRGILRKTSVSDFHSSTPRWTTVVDLDALAKTEKRNWAYRRLTCIEPTEARCILFLSDGGGDRLEGREIDTATGHTIENGFTIPDGKIRVAWEDQDHLLVATSLAASEETASGYPFIVRRLERGRPLASAVEVFRSSKDDNGYGVTPVVFDNGHGRHLTIIEHPLTEYLSETYILTDQGVQKLDIPLKARVKALVADQVIVQLDEQWNIDSRAYPAGSVVRLTFGKAQADPTHLDPQLLWSPKKTQALRGISATSSGIIIQYLDNVQSRMLVESILSDGKWQSRALALPNTENETVDVASTDASSDRVLISETGFITPTSYWLADATSLQTSLLMRSPALFDASGDEVDQFFATSKDGTRIPYFIVHPRSMAGDGSTPTLIYAYGGFSGTTLPIYQAGEGKLWLENGGAYVMANIRGGGEFGPAWHEAGIGTKRQVVYDDFAAVAYDLIARKITSPRRLGIIGASNGGLLTAVEMIQHPKLWSAVVIGVPLLDMLSISRIAAGKSWQAEYGDVDKDPVVRAFWLKTSPYQNLSPKVRYPEPFIYTTSKDDRVGPQHARKFAARLESFGQPVFFYENSDGGHGVATDAEGFARFEALEMTYLRSKLMN